MNENTIKISPPHAINANVIEILLLIAIISITLYIIYNNRRIEHYILDADVNINKNTSVNTLTISNDAITTIYKQMFDKIYPVGSIYYSKNKTNPKNVFGIGTWEHLAGGKCVRTSEEDKDDGTTTLGDDSIQLKHMPSHSHEYSYVQEVGRDNSLTAAGMNSAKTFIAGMYEKKFPNAELSLDNYNYDTNNRYRYHWTDGGKFYMYYYNVKKSTTTSGSGEKFIPASVKVHAWVRKS